MARARDIVLGMLIALAAFALGGLTGPVPPAIEAREFRLIDGEGRAAIVLKMQDGAGPAIVLDGGDRGYAILKIGNTGASLGLSGGGGQNHATLAAVGPEDGSAGILGLKGQDGKEIVWCGPADGPGGGGEVAVRGPGGKATLRADR